MKKWKEKAEPLKKAIATLDGKKPEGYQEPKPMLFKLFIETDETGNNTNKETLAVSYMLMNF